MSSTNRRWGMHDGDVARPAGSAARAFVLWLTLLFGLLWFGPAAHSESDQDLQRFGDERLVRVTSFASPPTPLGELLQKLSRQTGITLRAERTIAEHRAILVVREKPVYEILEKLAEAFSYRWRRAETKSGLPEYMLFQPAQDRIRQAEEVAELRQRCRSILAGALHILREQPVDDPVAARARLREAIQSEDNRSSRSFSNRDDLVSYLQQQLARDSVLSSLSWGAMSALAHLSAQEWQRLQQGEVLVFDTSSANSPLPLSVVDIARLESEEQAQREAEWGFASTPHQHQFRERMKQVRRAVVSLWMDPLGEEIYHAIKLYDQEQSPVWAATWRRLDITSISDLALRIDELSSQTSGPSSLAASLSKRLSRQPALHLLSIPERLDVLGHLLYRYAQANEVCLVAEWYPYFGHEHMLSTEHNSRYTTTEARWNWEMVLSDLHHARYQLKASEDWVVVTQRLRALSRHYEIPERSIHRWFLTKGREGVPGLSDLAEMAGLEAWQLELLDKKIALMAPLSGLQHTGEGLCKQLLRHRPLRFALLAFGTLSSPQRTALIRGSPIPLASVNRQSLRYLTLASYYSAVESLTDTRDLPALNEDVVSDPKGMFVLRVKEETGERADTTRIPPDVLQSLFQDEIDIEQWLAQLSESKRKEYWRRHHSFNAAFFLVSEERSVSLGSIGWQRWLSR
jgi:hypothetical protein